VRRQAGAAPGELQRDATRFDAVVEALSKPADDTATLRIEIVALEPLRLLGIRNVGDYAELDLAYTRLFELACAQIEPDAIRGIYGVPHDDPRDVAAAQCRIDCALDTGADGRASGELFELNLAGGAYARMFHHGDYDRIHSAIDALYDWAIATDREIAARPLFVHYGDDPEQTPVQALRAEIFLPLAEATP
jgi:AraC family transcriptional regulator